MYTQHVRNDNRYIYIYIYVHWQLQQTSDKITEPCGIDTVKSLGPWECGSNIQNVSLNLLLQIDIKTISWEIVLM